jgi:hypothetical protein
MGIEKMRTTVKTGQAVETETDNVPKLKALQSLASSETTNIDNTPMLHDNTEFENKPLQQAENKPSENKPSEPPLSNPRIETAFIARDNSEFENKPLQQAENKPSENKPSEPPLSNPRIETAFEKKPENHSETKVDTAKSATIKPAIQEQLELEIQVNYELSAWTEVSMDILHLENAWKINLDELAKKAPPPTNNLSSLAKTQAIPTIEANDTKWSGVFEDIFRMETLRAEMTDMFAQQFYPQASERNQLSDKINGFDTASSWQQVAEQILLVENYWTEMLKTLEQN